MPNEELIRICKEFEEPQDVVIKKPYIPWIPKNWNKTLVLAEAQNLSNTYDGYVKHLKNAKPHQQVCRLEEDVRRQLGYEDEDDLGIAPWDDGSLKLAVEAAFNKRAEETAVSNAVLWSETTPTRSNKNPGKNLEKLSAELWSKLFLVLKPCCVIACGKVAQRVMGMVTNKPEFVIEICLPSKVAMSTKSWMFNLNDLLKRYREVRDVVDKHDDWVKEYKLNKVFFACHAVSVSREKITGS